MVASILHLYSVFGLIYIKKISCLLPDIVRQAYQQILDDKTGIRVSKLRFLHVKPISSSCMVIGFRYLYEVFHDLHLIKHIFWLKKNLIFLCVIKMSYGCRLCAQVPKGLWYENNITVYTFYGNFKNDVTSSQFCSYSSQ